jgi:hypothetical protein
MLTCGVYVTACSCYAAVCSANPPCFMVPDQHDPAAIASAVCAARCGVR